LTHPGRPDTFPGKTEPGPEPEPEASTGTPATRESTSDAQPSSTQPTSTQSGRIPSAGPTSTVSGNPTRIPFNTQRGMKFMTDSLLKTRQRLSVEEQTQLIELIMILLDLNTRISNIKTELAAETGLKPCSLNRYIQTARRKIKARESNQRAAADLELLLFLDEEEAERNFADTVNFYKSIIANPKTSIREQLQARERLDKLLGLYS
tara:strand:- start:6315 stop:6935 length:621 start_codon:yes stop_codon:yes gene_type:complete